MGDVPGMGGMGMPPSPGGMPGMPPMMPPPFGQQPFGPPLVAQKPVFYLTQDKMVEFSSQDRSTWTRRNERMLRHRKLFELLRPREDKLKPGQIAAVTNDAKAIVRKLASMLSNHPPAISVVSLGQDDGYAAERLADFLRWYRLELEDRYGQGPNGSRCYSEAEHLVRDGMLVDVTTIDPTQSAFPWMSVLPDPMTVYPCYAGDERIRTSIMYRGNYAEARKLVKANQDQSGLDMSQIEMDLRDRKDYDRCEIWKMIAKNPDTDDWELGIAVNSKAIAILSLGYDPITITYAAARQYELTTDPTFDGVERWENIGVGIYDLIEEPLQAKNQDYSMLREMMARESNPIKVVFSDDEGKVQEMAFEPGSNIHLWAEDKFQLASMNPDFGKFTAALQIAQQGIERGSIPASLYGEAAGDTGVQEFMVLGNARDQVYVYVKALERYYQSVYRKIVRLYRDFGLALGGQGSQAPGVPFAARGPAGIILAGQNFSVQDIQALGGDPLIRVEYSDITPQNEASRVQMAVAATREKILDLEDARRMLPEPYNENPQLIGQKVLEDMALMDPIVTQIRAMTAALLSPDPVMRHLAQMLLPGLQNQAQTQAMQSMQPPQPPMQPGAPGGPPQRGGQMPPAANPAEMGQNAGLPGHTAAVGPQGSQPGPQ